MSGSSIDSDFDRISEFATDPERRRRAELDVLLTHMRMANAQLAEYATQQHLLDKRIGALEAGLAQNTQITTQVRDMLDTGRTLFKVAGWVASGVKGIAAFGVACAAIWGYFEFFRGGPKP